MGLCSSNDSYYNSELHTDTAGLYLPPSTLQINTVFLGLALRVLYKTKEERNRSSEEKNSRRKLAK